jgi:hypothetical protein
MIKTSSALFLFFIALRASGQIYNYDASGHRSEQQSEKITVIATNAGAGKQDASFVSSAIGGVVGVVYDIVKTALSNREASYTASYTGTCSGQPLMLANSKIGFTQLEITRTTTDQSSNKLVAADIKLDVQQATSAFRFSVNSVALTQAKARIKKSGSNGKTVDINIDVKVDALYNVFDDKQNATLKSATLGDFSITVPGIPPGGNNSDATITTGWYQFIPSVPAGSPNNENVARGWYTITVTVKEANPYGLSFQKISDFFSNNSSDITGFLKALVPGSSSSSSGAAKN